VSFLVSGRAMSFAQWIEMSSGRHTSIRRIAKLMYMKAVLTFC
jgi:hypothetical protein